MFPDLAVTLSQRRWVCVVDPALLLLTPFGPTLVQRLGELVELWVVRTFWGVLDGSDLYREEPQRLAESGLPGYPRQVKEDTVRLALEVWERIRRRSDLYGLRLRYLGDNFRQSALPEHKEPDLLARFELLHRGMLARFGAAGLAPLEPGFEARDAALDVAALAAALNPALILTYHDFGAEAAPSLCRLLSSWGVVDAAEKNPIAHDPLAALERGHVRSLLVHAGLAPVCWDGIQLAVVHLLATGAGVARTMLDDMYFGAESELGLERAIGELDPTHDVLLRSTDSRRLWADARLFWYSV